MQWIRHATLTLISTAALFAFAGAKSPRSDRCDGCIRLKAIEARAKRQMLDPEEQFAPLITEAAQTISGMARMNEKLDDRRLDAIVSAYRFFIPKDHAGTLLRLTAPLIVANRTAIDAKVALLPKMESEYLADQIEKATLVMKGAEGEGPKATPPPAGTPGEPAP